MPRQRLTTLAAVPLAALAFGAAGCGSGGSSSGSSSTGSASTGSASTGSSSTGSSSTGGSSSSQQGGSGANSSSNRSEGLKVIGRPKFGKATGPVRSGTIDVTYLNISIRPDTLRVKAGSTVRWSNEDSVEHNVTVDSGPQRFASGNFGGGHSYAVELTRPGTIEYLCTNHPATMNGTIEVVR